MVFWKKSLFRGRNGPKSCFLKFWSWRNASNDPKKISYYLNRAENPFFMVLQRSDEFLMEKTMIFGHFLPLGDLDFYGFLAQSWCEKGIKGPPTERKHAQMVLTDPTKRFPPFKLISVTKSMKNTGVYVPVMYRNKPKNDLFSTFSNENPLLLMRSQPLRAEIGRRICFYHF